MRHRLASDFMNRLNFNIASNAQLKQRRVAIRNGYDSDDDNNYIVNVQVCVIHVILYNNFIMISQSDYFSHLLL